MFDPLNNVDIFNRREFNYYFKEGSEVMLDVDVISHEDIKKYSNIIGVRGIITECYSDMHAFGQGSIYQHEIKFDNGFETEKWYPGSKGLIVPTPYLIAYDKTLIKV